MEYRTRQKPFLPVLNGRGRSPARIEGLDSASKPAGMIVTVVRDSLRHMLDTGVERPGALHHVETVDQAAMLVCEPGVSALVVSPGALNGADHRILASLATRWSMIRLVALIDEADPNDPAKLIELGASGPSEVIDLRQSIGWNRLRSLVDETHDGDTRQLVAVLTEVLADASPGSKRFFVDLARSAGGCSTIRALASEMGVLPSTLMSRFFRARLPSPKCFLSATRLVIIRKLLDAPAVSLAAAAYRLQYSSPQSLGRTIRQMLGVTAGQFRTMHTYDQVLGHYLSNLFVPFRGTLRTFDPFGHGAVDGSSVHSSGPVPELRRSLR